MESKLPKTLAQMLVDAGFTSGTPSDGCCQDDIALIEQRFQITLPEACQDFFVAIGRRAGDFLEDCRTCWCKFAF